MVRSLVFFVLACPLCTVAIRVQVHETVSAALDVNESVSRGCSAEQCSTCCCKVTALESSDTDPSDATLYETLVGTAKPGYRDMPSCRGALGSKFNRLGACGKKGCKACGTSTLPACEKPKELENTCCRLLRPPSHNWKVALVPWYEIRGKTCTEYTGANIADTARMECCKGVPLGYEQAYDVEFLEDKSWCERLRS
eukprot:TRINITY_DN42547_c0_g1_i1.p1 TRINITY_DN42547_c0_g1~~TRINITY_DN42547_c0_g1_i1.p1  ORF type:complete len:197 (+),score=18.05 TRINITY_DN42547_c0_g1_i1:112-702(+)